MPTFHEVYQHALDLWKQIHPISIGIGAVISALTALFIRYQDVKKWWIERHDGKVLHPLSEARRTAQVKMAPGQNVAFHPFPFQEIVRETKRSERSVRASLRRLENRGLVHEVRDGWHLGPRPDALTFANIERRAPMASRWGGNRFNRFA
jgi:hypothetical protein